MSRNVADVKLVCGGLKIEYESFGQQHEPTYSSLSCTVAESHSSVG